MTGPLQVILALSAARLVGGCSSWTYYTQAVGGEIAILRARQPISELLADPAVSPKLKARLTLVQDARNWAVTALDLPDNGSYRSYANVGRPYVVWNVFAAGEFSVAPLQNCFRVAGCVGYKSWDREGIGRTSCRAQGCQSG